MIKNRLEKNFKKLKPWSQRNSIEAFRLYDRDIPEYPFIVDIYKDTYLVYDKGDGRERDQAHLNQTLEAIKAFFKASEEQIVLKRRERQEGLSQYEKLDSKKSFFPVREHQALFNVNLNDYLDTGLFLDHRPMRQTIYKTANGKKFLNLFCYTGSVSVFAALAGAQTVSVDMSQTYIKWAEDNFKLNGIDPSLHTFVNENALEWLKSNKYSHYFDIIFLDPPTFSNSKKMDDLFEVEKDQNFLVESCMKILAPEGILYFSNNKRKFKLSLEISEKYKIKDIGQDTIPQDFHDKKIHNCFEIRAK